MLVPSPYPDVPRAPPPDGDERVQVPTSNMTNATDQTVQLFRPVPLATTDDPNQFSPLVCLLRQQLEVFPIDPADVSSWNDRFSNTSLVRPRQVGLRCVHCRHRPFRQRAKGAWTFPKSTRLLYQAVRNWQRYHFSVCEEMPPEVRNVYAQIKAVGASKKSNKNVADAWLFGCQSLHLVDMEGGGIFHLHDVRSSGGALVECRVPLVPETKKTKQNQKQNPKKKPKQSPKKKQEARQHPNATSGAEAHGDADSDWGEDLTLEELQFLDSYGYCDEAPTNSSSIVDDEIFHDASMSHTSSGPDMGPFSINQAVGMQQVGLEGPDDMGPSRIPIGIDPSFGSQVGLHLEGGASRPSLENEPEDFENQPKQNYEEAMRELAQLSITEFAEVQSDLSGIPLNKGLLGGSSMSDRPRSTLALSTQLDRAMQDLPNEETSAYYKAVESRYSLVTLDHKMAFFRSVHNDIDKAAAKMARYWQARLDLFGPERCYLPMSLGGAMATEVDSLCSQKVWRVLPNTDKAGRAVLYLDHSYRDFSVHNVDDELRHFWYLVDTLIQNAELRCPGYVVLVNIANSQRHHFKTELTRKLIYLSDEILPIRLTALHVCFVTPIFYYLIWPVFRHIWGKEIRLRTRIHIGTQEEVMRDLELYSFSKELLPRELGGDVVLDMDGFIRGRLSMGPMEGNGDGSGRINNSSYGFEAKRAREDNTSSSWFGTISA